MTDDIRKTKKQLIEELRMLRKSVEEFSNFKSEIERLNKSLLFCEQKFKKLIDNIPDIFYTLDYDGNITYISDAIKQYGYSPEKLIGTKIIELVHPDDRKKGKYRINERRSSTRKTKCYEIRLLTKGSSEVPFEMRTKRIEYEPVFQVTSEGIYDTLHKENKQFLGTLGIARDITGRKRADEKVKKYRKELEDEVESFKILVNDLNKIGIALSLEHNTYRLLDMIVRELRSFTNSDGGSLYLKEGDELSFEVAQNDTLSRRSGAKPFKPFKLPINHKSIAGYVASTGKILNISDLDKVGDKLPFSLVNMRKFDSQMNYKSVSMLAVPMRNHKEEIIGVIQLINSLDSKGIPVPFDENIENLVISLSSQAAIAICNSRFILDIKNLFESIVTYSAQAIDARSPHTAGHSERVAKLTVLQAESINRQKKGPFADINFSEEGINEIRIAALLHDIGKIGVRERVLDKVNKLSNDKIESITNRFSFIKRDFDNRVNIRKLTSPELPKEEIEAIEAETRKLKVEIDSDLVLINKLNLPKYYSDEEEERLKEIAEKEYININSDKKNYIEQFELENLIVRKGNLTQEERKEIESHVYHTVKILNKIPFTDELINVPVIAATHHEMLNGTGYPKKLTAKNIPLQARMLAVADIYDALTAKDRPYKPPLPLNIALKILREEAENGRLDSDLVELFISEETYKIESN